MSYKVRYANTHILSTNTSNSMRSKDWYTLVSSKVFDFGYVGEEIVLEGVLHEEMAVKILLGAKTLIDECGLDRIL